MHEERWLRIDELFHSALELEGNCRAAFLEQTCSGDTELRVQVERLLIHYNESFLEEPAFELAARERQERAEFPATEGELVAHYRVGAKLGSGGMGVVYEGADLKLGREVPLKFLYDDLTRERQAINRLEVEARAASSLNHPNICTIYAIEEHRGEPVLVMELLEARESAPAHQDGRDKHRRADTAGNAGLRRSRRCAQEGHRALRHQAGEHICYPRGQVEAAGFRSSEMDAGTGFQRTMGPHCGHDALHVARAAARR